MRFCPSKILLPLALLCAAASLVSFADEDVKVEEIDPNAGGGAMASRKKSQEDQGPQIDPKLKRAMDDEAAFIGGLIDISMPDLAAPVIERAKKAYPLMAAQLAVLEQKGELRLGHFDKVQAIVDKMKKGSPEYWGLKVEMANAYYSRRNMEKCSALYNEFFQAVPKPTPELMSFYQTAAYSWIQILKGSKKFEEAAKIYDSMLLLQMEDNVWCMFAMENVELLLSLAGEEKDAKKKESYVKRANKLADKLLWKQDLIIVFGRAVAMKAHCEMLRGKVDRAQELVNEFMPQLSDIHTQLKELDPEGKEGLLRLSPMPQCRYLLAKLLWDDVQKEIEAAKPDENKIKDALFGARAGGSRNGMGAYNHALNVFIKYPESTWAVAAGELADKIEAFTLERYKKAIKKQVTPEQMAKVQQMQFRNAYDAFMERDYPTAIKLYLEVLATFPEALDSVGAVANLAESYFELWKAADTNGTEKAEHRTYCDAVEGYLAERFSGHKDPEIVRRAGDNTVRFASREHDVGSLAQSQRLYDTYFRCYKSHYQAPQLALSLAEGARKNEDYEGAIRYYKVIASNYTNSTHYAAALQLLSICYEKLGEVDKQLYWLRKFANSSSKPMNRIASNIQLANIQQKQGFELFKKLDAEEGSATNEVEVAQQKKAAAISIVKAIKDFQSVVVDSDKAIASKMTSRADKEKIAKNKEIAQYLQGECWQRMTYPVGNWTIDTYRERAVAAFEAYLKDNPQGRFAPQAYVKMSTIFTAQQNTEKAKETLAKLQKDFPDSDEAKNSVPRLAKALIDMGMRREGVEQYEQMLKTAGNYTSGQFLQAGEALLEARSWDVAKQAYQKVLDLSKDKTNATYVVSRALLGQAKCLFKSGRHAEALEAIQEFIDNYSKTAMVIDAYTMLIEVASEQGKKEKDNDLRRKYFNQAIGAIKKVRGYKPEREDELALMSADVLVDKMTAEESMGLKDEALESCRSAAGGFQAFLMAHEPTDEHPAGKMTAQELANLERCYGTLLPLMAKLGADVADNVIRYGEKYLELFPEGKRKTAVLNAMNQAKAEVGGEKKPEEPAAANDVPEDEPVPGAEDEAAEAPKAEEASKAEETPKAEEAAKEE